MTSSRIYNQLSLLFKKPLADVAESLGYSESNQLILKQDFASLKSNHPNVWNNLMFCNYQADGRTLENYALDLVSSWVYEDTLASYLTHNDLIVRLGGGDSTRVILPGSRVSSTSDYVVRCGEKTRNIELMNSYTNYWAKNSRLDLRDNKYNALKNSLSLLLCVDLYNQKYCIIDMMDELDFEFIENHGPYGGKSAFRIHFDYSEFIELSIPNLRASILTSFSG